MCMCACVCARVRVGAYLRTGCNRSVLAYSLRGVRLCNNNINCSVLLFCQRAPSVLDYCRALCAVCSRATCPHVHTHIHTSSTCRASSKHTYVYCMYSISDQRRERVRASSHGSASLMHARVLRCAPQTTVDAALHTFGIAAIC